MTTIMDTIINMTFDFSAPILKVNGKISEYNAINPVPSNAEFTPLTILPQQLH